MERAEEGQWVHARVSCSLRSKFDGAPIVSQRGVGAGVEGVSSGWPSTPPACTQAPTGHQGVFGVRGGARSAQPWKHCEQERGRGPQLWKTANGLLS